jgi:2-keto-4-pentenoate hydratase/2-oxohepta-3-ene-1,7-dioic acid hydratase in catechol pathway
MSKPTAAYALGTFSVAGAPPFPGLILGDQVIALAALPPLARELGSELMGTGSLLAVLDDWGRNGPAIDRVARHLAGQPPSAWPAPPVDVALLRVHAPIEQPRQFFCAGANYRKHVIDLIVDQERDLATQGMNREERLAYATRFMDERAAKGTPYVFTRAWSSITGPFDAIPIPQDVEQPDWELELAVVMGRPAFQVRAEEAYAFVAGYTIVNDLTNRELVHRQDLRAIGSDWVMGKCLPGYAPMGPYLVPASLLPNPQDLRITLKLNGDVMQDESTADMIFGIPRLIEYLTRRIRLFPGDVLLTGSPAGNGSHYNRYLRPGDVMEGSIAGIGTLRNRCVAGA